MNIARDSFTATTLQNGKVLIAGGISYPAALPIATCELYDPATATFSKATRLAVPRFNHTATLLNNGMVLIAGGVTGDPINGDTQLASAELYDPNSGTFSYTGSLNIGRTSHSATLLGNGMVLVSGGKNVANGELTDSELYDPSTGTFSSTGALNTARDGHTATLLNDGTVLIAGGQVYQQAAAFDLLRDLQR